MAKVHTWRFDVRTYELDEYGHVNNAVYHNYLEEGATQASAAAGFPYDWYMARRCLWVIRRMTIRYLTPLRYGDTAELRTWVSDVHRVYSHREYDLRRVGDDQPVVRARVKWVYVDMDTMRPQRIPEEFEAGFEPTNELEDLDIHLHNPTRFENSPRFESRRVVQRYELDPAAHVNNAVYLNWIEQSAFDALRRIGWPDHRLREIGLGIYQVAHDIEYLQSARNGDPIVVISQPVELARVRGAWMHEVRHGESGELLAKDYAVGAFLDLETGRPRPLPDDLLEALLKGPSV
jgi:acyl-CoA thioester hydrolase